MEKNQKVYVELAKAKVQAQRNIVISRNETNGGYTMAQQLTVLEDNKKPTNIFIKGAIHIKDLEALYNLRDALNEAIKKEEDI